jgi:hypothetical protein
LDLVNFAYFVDFAHFVDFVSFMSFAHSAIFMDFVHFANFVAFVDFACPWGEFSLQDRRSVQTGIYSRPSAVVMAHMTSEAPFDIG